MSILAYDLGASSGRVLLGELTDSRIVVEEIHRFSNDPVKVGERLHWDLLRLYHEVQQGLIKAKHRGVNPSSLAIDSWAVDFGLIGETGELLGNPYHYRDWHTHGVMEEVQERLGKEFIFQRTGIQFLTFNTIYQLAAMRNASSPLLEQAKHFLMIPDLLRYFLTGEMYNEFSNATSTQLYNPMQQKWDDELLSGINIPHSWFGEVLEPGNVAGTIRSSVMNALGIGAIPVIAVAEHDTGSAVAAVPALERSFAYLSCGTWSLMGTETAQPVINDDTLRFNFTNEGGVSRTYRLLKNIMGLWILQETRREWERQGYSYSFPELVHMAEQAPAFTSMIDPDDELFLHTGDMKTRIRQYCRNTRQPLPETPGEITRCILESLALKYRYILELTEQVSGQRFNGLHMVGGGIQNRLLCQWTANSIQKPVWAGPAEASAIGNLAVQWMTQGKFADIWEARRVIANSISVEEYEPAESEAWEDAYGQFRRVAGLFVH
ncbi:rhamnulokinase [Paenibacillus polymyxa]|uniref:rhamnulokinase n=1 Tax=Paenibacillus polymyxa TaxID=1406 RepID=UPI0004D41733|nr:rhamnulokinase [Paenibacillus polymyxa]KEO76076.1 carbohydrate kinase [Paenibacillus polymyxa]MCH6190925.1 rhamnulokinase [Paenibacillus polymyxa]WRL59762.1 rhamnulokinase [Paenibacillus polymyxa]